MKIKMTLDETKMENIILKSHCRHCKKLISWDFSTPIHKREYCSAECWHEYYHKFYSGPKKPQWETKMISQKQVKLMEDKIERFKEEK